MTAAEAYDLTTRGGAGDFAQVVAACEAFAPYCLIGGLAVNCYVEPVYTLDADIVAISHQLPPLLAHLQEQGFKLEAHTHSGKRASIGQRSTDSVYDRMNPIKRFFRDLRSGTFSASPFRSHV